MESKKILFVLNPIAGRKGKDEFLFLAGRYCALNNITHINYPTKGDESDEHAIMEVISSYRPDAIVAVGGDGTVNLVARLLVHYPVPLGIVPIGSSNGLAKDLGIPENIIQALELIHQFKIHSIDALKVNGIFSFHMADLGFNAKIVNRFANSMVRGKISYAWFGFQELFSYKPFSYTIETEQMIVKGSAFMITMTNVNRFGNNVNINPLGENDDGYFEISILKPFSLFSTPQVLYHLLSNSIHTSGFNRVIRCRKAIIKTEGCDSLHIDGEPIRIQDSIDVKIVPKGLQVIVP